MQVTLGGRERSGQRTMWVKVPIARGDPTVRLDGALLTLAPVQTVAQQTPPPHSAWGHIVWPTTAWIPSHIKLKWVFLLNPFHRPSMATANRWWLIQAELDSGWKAAQSRLLQHREGCAPTVLVS